MPSKLKAKSPKEHWQNKFWEKVKKTTGCWIWEGARQSGENSKWDYGVFGIGYRTFRAHRISWMLHYGEIPEGMFVCHHCDTPSCVNPNHLFIGTNQDNMRDCIKKGRGKNGKDTHPEKIPRGDAHWTRINPEKVSRGPKHIAKCSRGKEHGIKVSNGMRIKKMEDGKWLN